MRLLSCSLPLALPSPPRRPPRSLWCPKVPELTSKVTSSSARQSLKIKAEPDAQHWTHANAKKAPRQEQTSDGNEAEELGEGPFPSSITPGSFNAEAGSPKKKPRKVRLDEPATPQESQGMSLEQCEACSVHSAQSVFS